MKKMLTIFLLLLAFSKFSASDSENVFQDDYSEYNEKIYEKYIKMDMQLKELAGDSVKKLLPLFLEIREHVNISASCSRNLFDLITGFRKLTLSSFNFLDSIGKVQSGVLSGNAQMFGEYEECIETSVMKKGKVDYQGQYCSLEIKPYLPKVKEVPGMNDRLEGLVNATRNVSEVMKLLVSRAHYFYTFNLNLGICVPSGCTEQDISDIIKYSLGEYTDATVTKCFKKGDLYFWTPLRIIIVSIFTLLGIIVVTSTYLDNTLDSWKEKNLGLNSRILQCFSLTRNFPKLMSTDVSENSITCFNGIRVLSIFWVVLGHEYYGHITTMTSNHMMLNLEKDISNLFSQIVFNGFIAVDIFFFMSGFFNGYLRLLIKKEGIPQPGILKIVVHRFWRIFPAYIVTFLIMFLLNKPQAYLFNVGNEFYENCKQNWWQNILFINNFFGLSEMCMPQTWYLCVDTQLFFLSLVTVPFLLRNPKKGVILHIAIILIVNVCSMSWWLVDDVPPGTFDASSLERSKNEKSTMIYNLLPVHIGPYFIGILLGYVIATKKEIKIPKVIQLFGWLAGSLLFTSMLFMTLRWNSGTPYTRLESAVYGAFSRTIAVLGFSWLVFCCATGHSRLINYILSLKLWIPLSRLTYMMYLVSPVIQMHYRSNLSFPDDYSDMKIIWTYFADLFISILMSFALVLIVESPIIAMEKIFFGRYRNENKTSADMPKELTISNSTKENGVPENGNVTTIHM